MISVRIRTIADHLGMDTGTTCAGRLPLLKDQDPRALPDHEAIPPVVKGTARALGVVVPRRESAHHRKAADAQRGHSCLGASGDGSIEITIPNRPKRFTHPVSTRGARTGRSVVHSLGAKSHRDLRRSQITDQFRNKERGQALEAILHIVEVRLLNRLEASNADTHDDADAFCVGIVDRQTRVLHRASGRSQAVLDEGIHFFTVFLADELICIKTLDLAGDLAGVLRGVEAGDARDAGAPLADRLPAGLHVATQGAYQTQAGHGHSPPFESISTHSTPIGMEAHKDVSSRPQIGFQSAADVDASAAGLYHPIMSARSIVGILVLLAMATACNSKRVRVPAADEVYARGTMAHDSESYESAIREYRFFLDHYPLDPRAEEVERRVADAYFEDGLYPEAIATYGHFQHMHPTSADQALIEYRIGEAYRLQMDTVDRDLASAQNAHERYRNLALRFPDTAHADRAREQLAETREHLAQRELYVAEYYAENDQYRAATTRAGEVVIRFPDTAVTESAIALLQTLAEEEKDQTLDTLSDNAMAELKANASIPEDEQRPLYAGPALKLLRLHLEQFKTQPATARTDN